MKNPDTSDRNRPCGRYGITCSRTCQEGWRYNARPNIDDHYCEMASKELGIPEYSSF